MRVLWLICTLRNSISNVVASLMIHDNIYFSKKSKICSLEAVKLLETAEGQRPLSPIIMESVPDCFFMRTEQESDTEMHIYTDMYIYMYIYVYKYTYIHMYMCACDCKSLFLLCGAVSRRVSRVIGRYDLFVVRDWSLVVDLSSLCCALWFSVVVCCCCCRCGLLMVIGVSAYTVSVVPVLSYL